MPDNPDIRRPDPDDRAGYPDVPKKETFLLESFLITPKNQNSTKLPDIQNLKWYLSRFSSENIRNRGGVEVKGET